MTKELTIGKPCESPWAGRRLTVLRRFDHADVQRTVTPVEPVRKSRVPAVLLDVKGPSGTESVWLQRYGSRALTVNGSTYDLVYGNQRVKLGFSLTLKDFEIGYYPGTRRPRSYESQVSIRDPASGRTLNRVISMNHPTAYGGYTFYQSSYRRMGERMISTLSVSRDPGQPLVFLGYLGMLAGMLLVLGRRIAENRGPAGRPPKAGSAESGRAKPSSSNR
jgi:cytochrome c biogenesis protein ResB